MSRTYRGAERVEKMKSENETNRRQMRAQLLLRAAAEAEACEERTVSAIFDELVES